jgi:hypothetical protein
MLEPLDPKQVEGQIPHSIVGEPTLLYLTVFFPTMRTALAPVVIITGAKDGDQSRDWNLTNLTGTDEKKNRTGLRDGANRATLLLFR